MKETSLRPNEKERMM